MYKKDSTVAKPKKYRLYETYNCLLIKEPLYLLALYVHSKKSNIKVC